MKNVIPGKTIVVGITIVISLGLIATPAEAYIYGEEEPTSQLIVDKQVITTEISDWQDDLPASQIVLGDGDLIKFRITIKNSGDKDLKKIQVTDTLPQYLNIIFNPGEFNQENDQITWQINELKAGDQETFEIRAHINSENENIIDGTLCLINKVEAKAESGENDQDTASFCIVAPQVLPEAGSGVGEILIGTGFATIISLAGLLLRKYGRGQI